MPTSPRINILSWLLYTSLFAAFCALGLSMATERLFLRYFPPLLTSLHALIFGSTLLVYNTHYLIRKSEMSDRFDWTLRNHYWHYFFWLAGLALCVVSAFFLPFAVLKGCALLALLSFAYSIPLLPFRDKRRLKDFGYLKIVVLTSVWTIVTAVLPMLYWDMSLSDYPFEIMIRFVFMFVLCLAFDLRDMQTDRESRIMTLPNRIGVTNTYRLMYLGTALFAVFSMVQFLRYGQASRFAAELVTALYVLWALGYTRRKPSDMAYLLYVDGAMLFCAVAILL